MRKILLAEDEADLAGLLSEALARAGYEPVVRGTGTGAWSYLRGGGAADLAVLDVHMPGIDGLELCRRIRAHPRLRELPVLMMTVRGLPDEQVEGYETGADDYLVKPFPEELLLARVRALERRLLER